MHDLMAGLILLIWNLYVVYGLSKAACYQWNPYISRKVIHIFAAGVSIALTPYIFQELWVPLALGICMICLVILGHIKNNLTWFQKEGNYADVYFCVCYTLLLYCFWDYDLRYAVVPILFMSIGDGITGIIRNFVYGYQVKGLWGSLGMLLVCMLIGYIYFGYIGLGVGIAATMLEWQPIMEDNIAVPLGTAYLLWLVR